MPALPAVRAGEDSLGGGEGKELVAVRVDEHRPGAVREVRQEGAFPERRAAVSRHGDDRLGGLDVDLDAIKGVGIMRIDQELDDLELDRGGEGGTQSPRAAGVGAAPERALGGPGPDHPRVFRIDGQRADRDLEAGLPGAPGGARVLAAPEVEPPERDVFRGGGAGIEELGAAGSELQRDDRLHRATHGRPVGEKGSGGGQRERGGEEIPMKRAHGAHLPWASPAGGESADGGSRENALFGEEHGQARTSTDAQDRRCPSVKARGCP